MDWVRKSILFGIGGGGYVALELLYRGRSHISMFAAGGVCFLLIGQLDRLRLAWPVKMVCGAGTITCLEFLTGLLVNRNYQVWDYRDQPGSLMGQICPRFMLLWIPLSLLAMVLYRWVSKGLDRLAG